MMLVDRMRRAAVAGVVALLVIDMASAGFCCMNGDAGTATSAAVSSETAPSPDGPVHTDDDCFCCARSLATVAATALVVDPVTPGQVSVPHWLQPPSLPAPYHPPQTRS